MDPIKSEEHSSNFELTIIKDLLSEKPMIKSQKIHGSNTTNVLPHEIISALEKLYLTQIGKLPFDIRRIQKNSLIEDKQVICISGL